MIVSGWVVVQTDRLFQCAPLLRRSSLHAAWRGTNHLFLDTWRTFGRRVDFCHGFLLDNNVLQKVTSYKAAVVNCVYKDHKFLRKAVNFPFNRLWTILLIMQRETHNCFHLAPSLYFLGIEVLSRPREVRVENPCEVLIEFLRGDYSTKNTSLRFEVGYPFLGLQVNSNSIIQSYAPLRGFGVGSGGITQGIPTRGHSTWEGARLELRFGATRKVDGLESWNR